MTALYVVVGLVALVLGVMSLCEASDGKRSRPVQDLAAWGAVLSFAIAYLLLTRAVGV